MSPNNNKSPKSNSKKAKRKSMKMTTSASPLMSSSGGVGPPPVAVMPHLKAAADSMMQQVSQVVQPQPHMVNNNNNMIHNPQQQQQQLMMSKQQQMQQQQQAAASLSQQQQQPPTSIQQQQQQHQQPQPVNLYTTAGYNQTLSPNNNNVKQCTGCGVKIIDRFLLHAMDKYWHTGCLKCSCCQAPLGDIGGSCFTRNGMILCKNDYLRLFGNTGKCSGCGQGIPAQEFVMKAQSHVYHVNCFSCVVCHCKLIRGDRYSIYQGNLLCEHDFPKVVRGNIQVPPPMKVNKIC